MKAYTSLEQSKKLAEILPIESADMQYPMLHDRAIDGGGNRLSDIPSLKVCTMSDYIPCWSVAALLDVLNKSAYFANEAGIAELSSIKGTKWCVSILNCGKIEDCYADEPVDACYEMILKLYELKIL